MSSDEGFLRAIQDDPGDDSVRLIYADWLDERGDPRGEFIRVQCRLAHLSPDDEARPGLLERERELLEKHAEKWLEPLRVREYGAGWQFRRGFVSSGEVDWCLFDSKLFELAPALEEVAFRDVGGKLSWLVELPECAALTCLNMSGSELTSHDVNGLSGSAHLRRLRRLNLSHTHLDHNGFRTLLESENLPRLAILNVSHNALEHIPPYGAVQVRSGALEQLNISHNELDAWGLDALLAWPSLAKLTVLNLAGNRLGLGRGADIAGAGLSGGEAAVRWLMKSSLTLSLQRLDVSANALGDEGAGAFFQYPELDRDAKEEGDWHWEDARKFTSLEFLDLRDNGISEGMADRFREEVLCEREMIGTPIAHVEV
jgi:uncharacterized protein (TIGR02996 family)